ncbi:hypothetical protein H2248_010422 [Termitomyces sp. 'cryptogamus']|nr:hypothetical protein H2248_010422 [Termitomyces sp. 'cryptogamus']
MTRLPFLVPSLTGMRMPQTDQYSKIHFLFLFLFLSNHVAPSSTCLSDWTGLDWTALDWTAHSTLHCTALNTRHSTLRLSGCTDVHCTPSQHTAYEHMPYHFFSSLVIKARPGINLFFFFFFRPMLWANTRLEQIQVQVCRPRRTDSTTTTPSSA